MSEYLGNLGYLYIEKIGNFNDVQYSLLLLKFLKVFLSHPLAKFKSFGKEDSFGCTVRTNIVVYTTLHVKVFAWL